MRDRQPPGRLGHHLVGEDQMAECDRNLLRLGVAPVEAQDVGLILGVGDQAGDGEFG